MTGVASLLADALAEGVRQYLNDMMSVSTAKAKAKAKVVFVPKTPLAKPRSIVFITQPKWLPRQPAGPPPRSLLVKARYFGC